VRGVVIYDWLKCQRVFDGKFDIGTVWQIEFSREADFAVVAGSEGGVLIAVQDETYEHLPLLRAPFALTPDGNRVLYANADTTIKSLELRTGIIERTLSPLGQHPRRLQTTASGDKVIASGGGKSLEDPGWVRVWDLTDGIESSRSCWAPSILGFGELPNGELLALDLNHFELTLWLLDSGSRMVLDTMARATALTPDGRTVVSFDGQGNLKVWDPAPFAPSPEFNRATTQVGAITFSGQGTTFASVNYEGTKIWRTTDGSLLKAYPGNSYLEYRSVSADGRFVAFVNDDDRVSRAETWNSVKWSVKNENEDLRPYKVVMSESGAEIAALDVSMEKKQAGVRLMLFGSATPRSSVVLRSNAISAIALSPDGKRLLIVVGKCLSIWDVHRGVRLSELDLPKEVYIEFPSYFTRSGLAVVCCSDCTVLIVETKTRVVSEIKIDGGFIESLGLSEDGEIAAISQGSVVIALDVRTKKKLAEMDLGTRISSAAISPDGTTIVVGDGVGSVHILELVKVGGRKMAG
jgi:WD40 repeat protein